MTVTTSSAHGLSVSGKASDVVLTGLAFTCALDDGAATHSYPRTTDPAYGGTPVTGVASVTQFTIKCRYFNCSYILCIRWYNTTCFDST